MKKVITYGTFDTLHYGHINLLERARNMGDHLTVGLSTDAFNQEKQKLSHFTYEQRKSILTAIKYVDSIVPENTWAQKSTDIQELNIDIFVIGDDWRGQFDALNEICQVIYLPRTPVISSSAIREKLDEDTAETNP